MWLWLETDQHVPARYISLSLIGTLAPIRAVNATKTHTGSPILALRPFFSGRIVLSQSD
jgi:hypothetical protein